MSKSDLDLFHKSKLLKQDSPPLISQTIKTINRAFVQYPRTHFKWKGRQLMASCVFEVIILVFVPARPAGGRVLPGADAVLSEVRNAAAHNGRDSNETEIEQWLS